MERWPICQPAVTLCRPVASQWPSKAIVSAQPSIRKALQTLLPPLVMKNSCMQYTADVPNRYILPPFPLAWKCIRTGKRMQESFLHPFSTWKARIANVIVSACSYTFFYNDPFSYVWVQISLIFSCSLRKSSNPAGLEAGLRKSAAG